MHCNVSDVVCVLINRLDLLGGVVVEDSEHVVVAAHNDPLLAGDELGTTHRRVRDFNRAHLRLGVVVVDHHSTSIECGKHPG